MPLFRKFSLGATGRANLNFNTVSGSAPLNGQSYMSAPVNGFIAAFASSGSAASDAYIGGFRYTSTGALRIYDATAGDPSPLLVNQGIAVTSDGQVCVSNGVNTTYTNLNGIAVSPTGVVFINNLSFALEFSDLGAGVVSTVEAIGGATPTFTRATAATTVLSTGLIGSVASGSPRSYYDPTTLAYLGYLAEGARTNLCLQSEDFATTWTNTGSTESTNATTAPDGASTADKLEEDATTNNHRLSQAFVKAASAITYSFSCFLKANERGWALLQLDDGTNGIRGWFNLNSGVVGSTEDIGTPFASGSLSIKGYPNGWYRCTITATSSTSVTLNSNVGIATGDLASVYAGSAGSGIVAWGAQVEAAAFASTYTPTTTASVAKNKTTGAYTFATGSAYTIYVAGRTPPAASGTQVYFSSDDGSANNYAQLAYNSSGHLIVDVVSGGGSVASLDLGAVSANTDFKAAFAVSANDFSAVLNGGTPVTDSSGAVPVSTTTVNIGQDNGAANTTFGPIRRVAYFGSRLSNAELQAITSSASG